MHTERIARFRELLKKYHITAMVLAAVSAALFVLAVLLLAAYVFPAKWSLSAKIRSEVPFPVALVEYHGAIPMNQLAGNLQSLRRFYEAQDFSKIGLRVDFSTAEGQQRLKVRELELVNKMLEDSAISVLARERGIMITDATASQEVAKRLNLLGSGQTNNVRDRLNRLYGWDLAAFEKNVVLPSLYSEALQKSFEAEAGNFAAPKEKIAQAKKELSDGRTFADVAKELSEGRSAKDGGELGWFSYDDLTPELRDAAKAQAVGTPGDAIESSLGFHILLVLERKSQDGKEMVHVAQVFTAKQTFAEWLAAKMAAMRIRSLVSEYQWNAVTSRMEFRDPAMRDLEKRLLENPQGDAAFLL